MKNEVKNEVKTIIITGASDGLGKALAELCIANKMHVVNISRRPLIIKGATNIPCDLANEQDIIKAAKEIQDKYSNFSALVNCAGIITFEEANKNTYPEIEKVIKVNTLAPIFLTSQLFDLIKQNEADVLNVGSTSGTKGSKLGTIYGTSKWALRGASENLRLELGHTSCRVIQFNPGGMETNLFKKCHGKDFDNPKEWMSPQEIAKIMFFILNLPKQIEISEIIINRKSAARGAHRA